MNAAKFPDRSVRAAVTAFGDSWCAAFINAEGFDCPPIRAEIRDSIVISSCAFAIAQHGRASTVRLRAGVNS